MTAAATMNQTAFAAHLGVGKPYVSNLKKAGRLVFTDDGLVDVVQSMQRIKRTTNAPERSAEALQPPGFTAQRERGEKLRNELLEMEVAEKRGELVKASDVRAVVLGAATTLRGQLESLPDQIAPQLAAASDEGQVRSLMASEIERLLTELSHQFGKLVQGVV
jgi:hypothetical protein